MSDTPNPPRVPSLRSISDPPPVNPLATVAAARRNPGAIPKDLQARMQAFHASRMGAPPGRRPAQPPSWQSAPLVPQNNSLAQRRMNAPTLETVAGSPGPQETPKRRPRPTLGPLPGSSPVSGGSMFDKYSQYVDAKTGSLKFAGKAVLHGKGVDFSSGSSFSMSLDMVDIQEELGKGNYGTVYRVLRRGPPPARGGSISTQTPSSGILTPGDDTSRAPLSRTGSEASARAEMAMKEIRLELDEAKFAQIIMELDVLHRCRSQFIIDFYGAFFQEGAVYICMEHMDGGSVDKLYHGGISEPVLRKIAYATVMGLKALKDDHNIIHRDVKPTNILVNTRGDVKLCDFGVSGNLVASIAKTNIGCQSYMAPERIASGGTQASIGPNAPSGTYGVQSDIWSLGLSLLECAMGRYPYPPETYNNIFSQLSAIVDGEPPDLPEDSFSTDARNFVRDCLHKVPALRPSYAQLLQHPWLAPLVKPEVIPEEEDTEEISPDEDLVIHDAEVAMWVNGAIERRRQRLETGDTGPEKPALHAAPLNAVSPTIEERVDGLKI